MMQHAYVHGSEMNQVRRAVSIAIGLGVAALSGCGGVVDEASSRDAGALGRASEASQPELLCFTQGRATFAPENPPSYDETGELDFENGVLQTRALLSHAYTPAGTYQRVRLRFAYATETVGSNEWRRQISLKLKAANSCNVLYVTWVFEKAGAASNTLEIKRKANEGSWLDSQCAEGGYTTLASVPLPGAPPQPGSTVDFEAELRGNNLRVWVDGSTRFNQAVAGLDALAGWAGIRTDNVAGLVTVSGSTQDPDLFPSPRLWYVATRSFDGTGSSQLSGAPFSNSCPYLDGQGVSQVGRSVNDAM